MSFEATRNLLIAAVTLVGCLLFRLRRAKLAKPAQPEILPDLLAKGLKALRENAGMPNLVNTDYRTPAQSADRYLTALLAYLQQCESEGRRVHALRCGTSVYDTLKLAGHEEWGTALRVYGVALERDKSLAAHAFNFPAAAADETYNGTFDPWQSRFRSEQALAKFISHYQRVTVEIDVQREWGQDRIHLHNPARRGVAANRAMVPWEDCTPANVLQALRSIGAL